jgi:hypothetical protein
VAADLEVAAAEGADQLRALADRIADRVPQALHASEPGAVEEVMPVVVEDVHKTFGEVIAMLAAAQPTIPRKVTHRAA